MPRPLPLLLAGLAGAALLGGAAGCSGTAGQQVVTVRFDGPAGTPPDPAVVARVRAACPGTAHAQPEPAPTSRALSERLYPLRYAAGGAGSAELAQLQRCLLAQPGVAGVNTDSDV